jgi:hypothetical protein
MAPECSSQGRAGVARSPSSEIADARKVQGRHPLSLLCIAAMPAWRGHDGKGRIDDPRSCKRYRGGCRQIPQRASQKPKRGEGHSVSRTRWLRSRIRLHTIVAPGNEFSAECAPPKPTLQLPRASDQVFDERVQCERVVFQSTPMRVWILPEVNLRVTRVWPGRFQKSRTKAAAAAEVHRAACSLTLPSPRKHPPLYAPG